VVSLVTPDMEERKGVWGQERRSYPVSESDIRKWAIAVYWPERPPPIFWDADYARTTRWGGIIAPQDFNPFAWPVERPMMAAGMGGAAGAGAGGGRRSAGGAQGAGGRRLRNMNGGQTDTYGVPMRPGDVITSRSRLRDWEERETRLGATLFVFSENEWQNQDGELVKRRVSTAIRY
jgi:acyl dehydratase